MPRGELGNGAAHGRQRLHLGSDVEAALVVAPRVQGDDAQMVARDDVAVLLEVVEDEGEDPVEAVQEVAALLRVQAENDLAVAACPGVEGVDPGLQLPVVVDLPVHGEYMGLRRVEERLGAVFHVDDGQPVVCQHGAVVHEDAGPVGAAVPLQLRERQHLRARGRVGGIDVQDGEDGAHGVKIDP